MKTVNVIIEMSHSSKLESLANDTSVDSKSFKASAAELPNVQGVDIDETYGVVNIPKLTKVDPFKEDSNLESHVPHAFDIDETPENATYIVRAKINEADVEKISTELMKSKNVKGVYADCEIQSSLICAGAAPVGNHLDVERLLCVPKLREKRMTGKGVYVAIVDTGINMAHLNAKGKTPGINLAWSWKPTSSSITLGSAPVGHGTMCAFDVTIAAPKCTLLDIALLSRTGPNPTPIMSGFLSDAILAYNHLIRFMNRPVIAGDNRSLVVNNSWGMFHPSWDFPVGSPGNFSSNPSHPFNVIVGALVTKGADVLFAAGNCGSECPDGRCQGVTNQGIYGANSHPSVTTVVGIGTNMDRVGYSNRGPGRLTTLKPDITGYTHFSGSGVYGADGGTSAATPVIAGVYAAIRTVRPYNSTPARSPFSIRQIVRTTARDIGATGFDFTYGYGLINGCKIVSRLFPVLIYPICEINPRLCELLRDRTKFFDFCKINPDLCFKLKEVLPKLPPDIDPEIIRHIREFKKEQSIDTIFDEIENILSTEDLAIDKKSDCSCGCND